MFLMYHKSTYALARALAGRRRRVQHNAQILRTPKHGDRTRKTHLLFNTTRTNSG